MAAENSWYIVLQLPVECDAEVMGVLREVQLRAFPRAAHLDQICIIAKRKDARIRHVLGEQIPWPEHLLLVDGRSTEIGDVGRSRAKNGHRLRFGRHSERIDVGLARRRGGGTARGYRIRCVLHGVCRWCDGQSAITEANRMPSLGTFKELIKDGAFASRGVYRGLGIRSTSVCGLAAGRGIFGAPSLLRMTVQAVHEDNTVRIRDLCCLEGNGLLCSRRFSVDANTGVELRQAISVD